MIFKLFISPCITYLGIHLSLFFCLTIHQKNEENPWFVSKWFSRLSHKVIKIVIIQSIFPYPQELEPDFSATVWDSWEEGFPFLLMNWKLCFLGTQLKTGNSKQQLLINTKFHSWDPEWKHLWKIGSISPSDLEIQIVAKKLFRSGMGLMLDCPSGHQGYSYKVELSSVFFFPHIKNI